MPQKEKMAPLRAIVTPEVAEIEKNDFNLNISRYISTAVAEEGIDLQATQATQAEIDTMAAKR